MYHFTPAEGAIVAIVLSAAARALPEPKAPSLSVGEMLYQWFYNFTHSILANWDKVKGNK